ncbi:uncharacterized protein LOC110816101 [Carica papaya]|uniref:uncharacterized protein LOC110816101 n=1 Tax=Carica papaya TaxID=3649 RepID=UPI000B8C7647|nr:uncharacterized protein LOC110816101 [Carica papaya]
MIKFAVLIFAVSLVLHQPEVKGTGLSRPVNNPIKTIKTEYGDIYDCVDIHKQPALEHPLLKDHKVQMMPSFAVRRKSMSPTITDSIKLGLETPCPRGTVPIRRTSDQELLKAQSAFYMHHFAFDTNSNEPVAPGVDFAGIISTQDASKKYRGAGGRLAIYQPFAQPNQFSLSMILLQSVTTVGQRAIIRTGWMVNPLVYGDTRSRFFTSWTQEKSGSSSGCYDLLCSGFVVVDKQFTPGIPFGNISTISGPKFDDWMMIKQDLRTGHWWLMVLDDNRPIGYWPIELFDGFENGAGLASWGGWVYSQSPGSPAMGSGYYVDKDYEKTCYIAQVSVNNPGDPKLVSPDESSVQVLQSRCYQAGDNSFFDVSWGYRFLFGGAGC